MNTNAVGKSVKELQDYVEDLLAQLKRERKFRAEFEAWLDKNKEHDMVFATYHNYQQIKAQHINSEKESEVEHNG